MDESKRIISLVLIMAAVTLMVTGITIFMLYRTALEQQRAWLITTAQSQARLIEAVARFDATYNQGYEGGSEDATLKQIIEAHSRFRGFGQTGEFTLARREDNKIVFLLSHRHYDFETPRPVSFDSELAEPMRRALMGLSGTVVGLDYRGELVLAAYEPVAELNLGIVAKIDLAEVRAPFMRAGILAVAIAVVVILIGTLLFFRISDPIMKRLRKHSQDLAETVQALQESQGNLRQAHDQLEIRVKERTAELMSANQQLKIEVRQRTQAEERLEALWGIAEMVDSEDEDLFGHILAGTLQMTQSKYAFCGFMNPDESVMSIYTWSNEALEDCRMREKPIEFPVAQGGLWAEAIRERRVLMVNDYQANHPGKLGLPEGHVSLSRLLVVPVFSQGRIVSVAAAANKPTNYDDNDVKQLEAFVSGVQTIITQRRVEKELKESEEKYSSLVENSLTGVYIALDGEIVFVNNRFAEIHGYSRNELMGMKTLMLVHPEERARVNEIQKKRLVGGEVPSNYDVRALKKDGKTIWTTRTNSLIKYKGKPAVLGNIVDISKRKSMEEALLKSEKECRLLSLQVLETEGKERKRFAREIHDSIGQSLAAIKFRTEACLRMTEGDNAARSEELKSVVQMIQGTMEEVRKIQNDLRPAYLDELGIMATLSNFCREFQTTYSGIRVETLTDISEEDVPEFLKSPIYRIFQEAMNNAAKHSQASRVRICLQKAEDNIKLSIEDNGVGFETSHKLSANAPSKGSGLLNMRERTELSGGSLELKSTPGEGTTIRATWSRKDVKAG